MNDRQHAGLLPQQNTLAGLKRTLLFLSSKFLGFWENKRESEWKPGLAPSPGTASPVWMEMLPNSLCYHPQEPEQPLLPAANGRHEAMRPSPHP